MGTWGAVSGLRSLVAGMQTALMKGASADAVASSSSRGAMATFSRSVVSVPVWQNNVEKALRTLKRKVVEEGLAKQWKSNEYYIKPAEQRKLDALETAKRLRKRSFKEKMRWIMQRKAR